jgi:hypothetical protein
MAQLVGWPATVSFSVFWVLGPGEEGLGTWVLEAGARQKCQAKKIVATWLNIQRLRLNELYIKVHSVPRSKHTSSRL